MTCRSGALLFACAIFWLATGAAAQAAGPAQAQLDNAIGDRSNWLYVDHDYYGQRYTPLDELTAKNAADIEHLQLLISRERVLANRAHRL
jgi:alcohol dehydrogenase (cytochrome c)